MYPDYPACHKCTETLPPKLCLGEALSVRPGTTLVSKEVLSHVLLLRHVAPSLVQSRKQERQAWATLHTPKSWLKGGCYW